MTGMLGVGVDLVRVSRVAESIEHFGDRFLHRVFTPGEIAYAEQAPALAAERLAARFAAKEAAIKALGLAEHGVNLRDIEVQRAPSGQCHMALHGSANTAATDAGIQELSVSLSHEGDYAIAVVVARSNELSHT